MTTALALFAVLLIVLANGFFVAAEYALVTMRRTRVQELVDQGHRGARRVAALQANPGRFISATQLGVTLSSLALGAIGEPVVSRVLRTPIDWLPQSWHGGIALTVSAVLAFVVLSYFHVVIGEIVPKSYTLQHSERVALLVATPITIFFAVFRPFIWVLDHSASAVLRWLGLPPDARRSSVHSEEELKMLVTASREHGVLEEGEQTMLHKVFEFADKEAADVMVPRPDVVALELDLPVSELLRLMLQHPYTRYPVYEGELDDIAGILHVRDLFAALHDRGIEGVDVRALLRPAIMVPETKGLDELLADFRSTSNHMAIVLDEYGSVAGLATLEDLLEEIVGEIVDEFDLPDAGIRRLGKSRMRLGGSFPIEEFNDRFGTSLSDDDYHSVGGYVFGELGRAPRVGDSVQTDGVRFEVSAVDGPRITEVDVELKPPPEPPAATEERDRASG
jgi:CBS domain containing-hemolysin-like protein